MCCCFKFLCCMRFNSSRNVHAQECHLKSHAGQRVVSSPLATRDWPGSHCAGFIWLFFFTLAMEPNHPLRAFVSCFEFRMWMGLFVCVGGWGVGGEAVWTELETAAGSVDVADLLHACKLQLSLYAFLRIYTTIHTSQQLKPGEVRKVITERALYISDAMPVTAIVPEACSRWQ